MKKPRPHLSMGESIHRALGAFYRITEPSQRTHASLQRLLRRHWERRGYKDEEEEREWGIKALQIIEAYFGRADLLAMPALIEDQFRVRFEDLELVGRIDRVDQLEDGKYELIDYKTGHSVYERELQVASYSLGLQLKYKFDVIRFSYHFLASGKTTTISVTPDLVGEGLRRIKDIVAAIRSTKKFTATPNQLCGWCDFIELCPLYSERAPVVEAEEQDWFE